MSVCAQGKEHTEREGDDTLFFPFLLLFVLYVCRADPCAGADSLNCDRLGRFNLSLAGHGECVRVCFVRQVVCVSMCFPVWRLYR